jgi:hypothetical protein
MFVEVIQQQRHSLEGTLRRTRGSLEKRMREAVWDMIKKHYPVKVETTKNVISRKYLETHWQAMDLIGDAAFSLGTGEQSKKRIAEEESVRRRPSRILNYIEKLVDLVLADFLIMFLSDCLSLGLEYTIIAYEARKGEAKSDDYFKLPTEIDSSAFKKFAW